jgi:hypothetical protein
MAEGLFWTGVAEFARSLEGHVTRASAAARAAVAESAAELEKEAKKNASGRPGPNVITGTLRRGIKHTPIVPFGVRGWATEVGPTVIYSRRIELGFAGPDSLGRVFDPTKRYPFFLPAWRSVAPRMPVIYKKHFTKALVG